MGRPKGSKNKVQNVTVEEAPRSETQKMVSELLSGLFKETMPQMMAAVVTAVKQAEAAAYQARQPKHPGEKCQDCGQFKIACGGKHRDAIVYPKNYRAKYAKFFAGVWLNGQKYLSSRPGQSIKVPEDFYPEVFVEAWEQNEIELAEGRQAEFNSGLISGRGNSTTFQADARAGWRS